jgi:hypothetical protein
VRAVEFRPDNPRIVHHAFVKVDSSGRSYQLDGRDGQPGFGGMSLPETVKMPSGYFLSYQPGKVASSEAPGFGWVMKPGQDLVIQAHLKPTGKPEELQAAGSDWAVFHRGGPDQHNPCAAFELVEHRHTSRVELLVAQRRVSAASGC